MVDSHILSRLQVLFHGWGAVGRGMIVLVAKYFVRPGHGDKVEDALRRMRPLVRDQEPGCLLYLANRSLTEPDVFLLYEQYRDEVALEAHRSTEHFRSIIEGLVVPLLVRRERELYRLVSA